MKVRMLVPMGGIKVQRNLGDEVDVSAAEAERLIDAGFAEPLKKRASRRTAVKPPAGKKTAAKKTAAKNTVAKKTAAKKTAAKKTAAKKTVAK